MADANAEYMRSMQADDGSSIDDLLALYGSGFDRVRDAIDGLSLADLRARPIDGLWSTLEVVGHLADCEQMIADRMKRTLSISRPLLIGFDPTGFPAALKYNERPLDPFLDLIRLTRMEMLSVLELCSSEEWNRDAIHSESGLVTLRQIVLQAVRHIEHHVPFIEAKREALEA